MTEASAGRRPGDDVPRPMLTVAAVARRLGVAPATLRTWDRRYGLGPSEHTAGSHRRYSAIDVGRLMVMRRLTLEGVPPSEAASIARASDVAEDEGLASVTALTVRPVPVGGPAAVRAGAGRPSVRRALQDGDVEGTSDVPRTPREVSRDELGRVLTGLEGLDEVDGVRGVGEVGKVGDGGEGGEGGDVGAGGQAEGPEGVAGAESDLVDGRAAHAVGGRSVDLGPSGQLGPEVSLFDEVPAPRPGTRSGGGRVVSLPDGTPAARGLARAAMALDSHECMRLIRQHIERHGTVSTWDHLVAPVLVAVGERWRATGAGVEVEHVLSEAVLSSLRTVAAGLRHPRNSRPVLLAAAEEEQHGLPLHVLTASLAEHGIASRLLGVRVPRSALAAAVRRSGPAVVFVYAHLSVREPAQLSELPRLRPSPLLLLGGPGWDGVETPPGVERVHDLTQATERIAAAVGA